MRGHGVLLLLGLVVVTFSQAPVTTTATSTKRPTLPPITRPPGNGFIDGCYYESYCDVNGQYKCIEGLPSTSTTDYCLFVVCNSVPDRIPCRTFDSRRHFCAPRSMMSDYKNTWNVNEGICVIPGCDPKSVDAIACMYETVLLCMSEEDYRGIDSKAWCIMRGCENEEPGKVWLEAMRPGCIEAEWLSNGLARSVKFKVCDAVGLVNCGHNYGTTLCLTDTNHYDAVAGTCHMPNCSPKGNFYRCEPEGLLNGQGKPVSVCVPFPIIATVDADKKTCHLKELPLCPGQANYLPCKRDTGVACIHYTKLTDITVVDDDSQLFECLDDCGHGRITCNGECMRIESIESIAENGTCVQAQIRTTTEQVITSSTEEEEDTITGPVELEIIMPAPLNEDSRFAEGYARGLVVGFLVTLLVVTIVALVLWLYYHDRYPATSLVAYHREVPVSQASSRRNQKTKTAIK